MKNIIISTLAGLLSCSCLPELNRIDHMALFCGVWIIVMYAACTADVAVEKGRRTRKK